MARYLGVQYCDVCAHGIRDSVWLTDARARLCRMHFEAETGSPPPKPLTSEDLDPLPVPAAEPVWTKVIPGLRARPAQGLTHGVELQAVRNIRMGDGTQTVGDGPAWDVPDVALVELFLMASAHRDDSAANRLLVRAALLRILHGKATP